MPAEGAGAGAGAAHGPTAFRPTPAAFAVIVGAVLLFAVFGEAGRVAIGFLVPLAGAAIWDARASARALVARDVQLVAVRSVADRTSGVTFVVHNDPGAGPVHLTLDGLLGELPVPWSMRVDEHDGFSFTWPGTRTAMAYFVRYEAACTRLGLVAARRATVLGLPDGVWRGPEPAPRTEAAPPPVPDLAGLRAYVPGDRLSRVSWPTTARTGRLHVRSEALATGEAVVQLDVPPGPDEEAERVLARAATVVGELLDAGVPVRLRTLVHAEGLRRRWAAMALADPGHAPWEAIRRNLHEVGPPRTLVDEHVTSGHDLLRRLAAAELGGPLPSPGCPHLLVDARGVQVVA